jgi:hypothetical protein
MWNNTSLVEHTVLIHYVLCFAIILFAVNRFYKGKYKLLMSGIVLVTFSQIMDILFGLVVGFGDFFGASSLSEINNYIDIASNIFIVSGEIVILLWFIREPSGSDRWGQRH